MEGWERGSGRGKRRGIGDRGIGVREGEGEEGGRKEGEGSKEGRSS